MSRPARGAGPRAAAALVLLAALGACDEHGDETSITLTRRDAAYDRSILTASGRGAVEIHGAPAAGLTAAETAALLRPPAGFPRGVVFAPLPPGGFDPRDPAHAARFRLALVFNARPPAAPEAICRAARELGGPPADAGGYSVDMALCRDLEPILSARMTARARGAADAAFAERTLRRLLGRML